MALQEPVQFVEKVNAATVLVCRIFQCGMRPHHCLGGLHPVAGLFPPEYGQPPEPSWSPVTTHGACSIMVSSLASISLFRVTTLLRIRSFSAYALAIACHSLRLARSSSRVARGTRCPLTMRRAIHSRVPIRPVPAVKPSVCSHVKYFPQSSW